MPTRLMVVSIDAVRLSVVDAELSARSIVVRAAHRRDKPEEVDAGSAGAMGAWLRRELRACGARARRALVVLPRGSVVLKRLTFPGGQVESQELPEMVRLQMARQLTMPIESAVLDFVPMESGSSGDVLAAAAPQETVEHARAIIRAAGLRLAGIVLRGTGLAALLADQTADAGGPVLGVAIGGRGLEIGVVDAGRLVFSRGVELQPRGAEGDGDPFARAIAVEVKRTWMSARGGSLATEISSVGVLGEGDSTERIAAECAELLGIPARAVPLPAAVRTPEGMTARERTMLAALVGLLVARATGRAMIDFASPRRAPDRSAGPRRAALLAMLGLIVSGGLGWTLARFELDDLRAEVKRTQDAGEKLYAEYVAHLRREARLEHARQLESLGVDWLWHIEHLTATLPPRDVARVDQLELSLSEAVAFERNGNLLSGGRWSSGQQAQLRMRASVVSREAATALRGVLVEGGVYEVENRGADAGPMLDLTLRTDERRPGVRGATEASPAADSRADERGGGDS